MFAHQSAHPSVHQLKRARLASVVAGIVFFCFGIFASAAQLVTVDYVTDGDTVQLANREWVRLVGINAPEKAREDTPAEPFSEHATRALAQLVEKRRVRMIVGADRRDRYGRTLAQLFLPDGTDVQEALLRQGYAMVVAYPPNVSNLDRHIRAESEARQAGRGVWGDSYFAVQQLGGRKSRKLSAVKDGFGRVAGVVTTVERSRKHVRITIGATLTVLIPHERWREFWSNRDARKLIGEKMIARGWVWTYKKQKLMKVRHPFMLQRGT